MERDFNSIQRDIQKINNKKQQGILLSYEDAMEEVKDYLSLQIKEKMNEEAKLRDVNEEGILIKDKEYLRRKKKEYRGYIEECISLTNLRVKNYEGERIDLFMEEMVEEFAGYSILYDAFNDKEVSDIFILAWDTIYIEKDGINQRYHKSFRSPKHLENVIKRFVGEAGKEINYGEHKIVDFELYGDRGCATSPGVSPRGYSLTLRKHAEDHITRNQLVAWDVMDEKMSDLLGMMILGEANMICAGITGSGKTTTIRALLDYYVTMANKRMLVVEDTQELFPKNEHTLELVSVKADDPKIAVSLKELIYTALRQKPKYIVVGEVRGEEAEAAVEGMETGHSTIFTMHGNNGWNIINRITTKYLMAMPNLGVEIVERIIGSAIDYVFIQDNIPGIGRRITNLSEVNYNFNTRKIELNTICKFDIKTKEWVWKNLLSEEKAEKMMRRGVPYETIREWIGHKEEKGE